MRTKRGRNERRRLLLLELAVVVPALALIGFSIAHLTSIQRDGEVEATMQRDFQQVLAMSEKEMNSHVTDMTEAARDEFAPPSANTQEMLQQVLEHNPAVAHAFIYEPDQGTVFVSRESRMGEPDFRRESEDTFKMLSTWFPVEDKQLIKMLWGTGKYHKSSIHFFRDSVPRGKGELYQLLAMFPLKNVSHERVTIAGVAFDSDYLKNTFFPDMLDYEADCPTNKVQREDRAHPALILRAKNDDAPLASSSNWNGGEPEVERNLDGGLPGLVLGIKLPGTTIKAISQHFLRTSYLVLGGLSLLMAGGIFLSYRSVNKEMAVAQLKSDFVSNVSHELRTPLALIRLYAETLELGRLTNPAKYQEYYRIIRKESERLSALINNILDFSRIEAGKKEYEFRETNMAELVRTTLDAYRFQIEQQGFAYEEHIPDDLPPLKVDREAMARALLNLVNNAVKYSAKNKFLAVSMCRSNGSVRLEVADRGIGIPRPEQGKIFEKFYRASDPLVHNTKGSGLGLALVRHVVEAHGGQVLVESAVGQGSKFVIELPVNGDSQSVKAGHAA